MKSKPTIPSKLFRIFAAVLVAGNVFFSLALPAKAHAAAAPGLVQNFAAPTSNDQIALNWEAPLDDGGSPVTGYLARIRLNGDLSWSSIVMQDDQLGITFDGLVVGEQYDVAVAATNTIGTGEDTEILNITVGSVPDVVENLQFVDNGDSVLRATWNPPTDTGSSAITSYDFAYSLTGAESWDPYTVSEPSAMIIGLAPALYDIRVRANNSVGAGEWTYLRNQYLGEVTYNITTCEELQAITNDLAGTYTLQNDIDCSGITNFIPIGMNVGSFTGDFEGNGHTISNLTINRPSINAGLFQVVSSTTIGNFNLHNATITGGQVAGAVTSATNGSSITNVHVTGSAIAATDDSAPSSTYAGGIVAYAYGTGATNYTVAQSSFEGSVSGINNVGGLVGYGLGAVMSDSHAGATTTGSENVGGLVGYGSNITISRSYATGAATATTQRAGGLVGLSEGDTISDSYARGNATTPNLYYAGGLIGAMNNSDLARVYSTGVVNGYGIIGGLVGYNVGTSTITDSFSASYVLPQDGGWDARANNGLVGIDYANEIIYNNVHYNTINNALNCTRDDNFTVVTSADCTGIDLQYNETMFKQAGDAPISNWDLGGIWHLNTNDFPTLSPNNDPQILCEQSTVTDTSVSVACQSDPSGWGATTWEMQYKKTSASTWNDVTLSDPSIARATITGLVSGTDYQVRFRFTNDWGTSQWGRIDAKTTGVAPVETVVTPVSSITRATTPATVTEQVEAESGKIYLNDFSEFKTSAGKTLELAVGQIVYFYVHGELHSATVTEIGPDYAILRIASEPQDVRISLGQAQEVSVLQNGSKDLRVSLLGVQEGKATLTFAELTTPPIVSAAAKPVNPGMAWWLFLLVIPVGFFLASHKSPTRHKHA